MEKHETIVATLYRLILDDDCNRVKQHDAIRQKYRNLTPKQKAIVDDLFLEICGYSLGTIISKGKTL